MPLKVDHSAVGAGTRYESILAATARQRSSRPSHDKWFHNNVVCDVDLRVQLPGKGESSREEGQQDAEDSKLPYLILKANAIGDRVTIQVPPRELLSTKVSFWMMVQELE